MIDFVMKFAASKLSPHHIFHQKRRKKHSSFLGTKFFKRLYKWKRGTRLLSNIPINYTYEFRQSIAFQSTIRKRIQEPFLSNILTSENFLTHSILFIIINYYLINASFIFLFHFYFVWLGRWRHLPSIFALQMHFTCVKFKEISNFSHLRGDFSYLRTY